MGKKETTDDASNTVVLDLTPDDGIVAVKATNKTKTKAGKQSRSKSIKSSSRRNSKQASRKNSTHTQSISRTGKNMSRRSSHMPSDDTMDTATGQPMTNISIHPREKSSQGNSIDSNTSKTTTNDPSRMGTSKEEKALNSAFHCLMDEIKRRREVRKNVVAKFGRANAKLKSLLAKQNNSGDKKQNPTDALLSLIAKKKTNTHAKPLIAKRIVKEHMNDDPDRI